MENTQTTNDFGSLLSNFILMYSWIINLIVFPVIIFALLIAIWLSTENKMYFYHGRITREVCNKQDKRMSNEFFDVLEFTGKKINKLWVSLFVITLLWLIFTVATTIYYILFTIILKAILLSSSLKETALNIFILAITSISSIIIFYFFGRYICVKKNITKWKTMNNELVADDSENLNVVTELNNNPLTTINDVTLIINRVNLKISTKVLKNFAINNSNQKPSKQAVFYKEHKRGLFEFYTHIPGCKEVFIHGGTQPFDYYEKLVYDMIFNHNN